MKALNRKVIFSIMLAVLLTPAALFARVYFMEAIDEGADAIDITRPCILDYPKRSCPDGKTPQNFCPSDNRYFKSCECDTGVYKYNTSNCKDNKILGGSSCDGKFDSCTCDTTRYKYDSTNCTGGKTLGGNSCDGKYDTCGCPSEYSKTCSTDNLIPADANDSCDGKYKSCKCPTSYVTCDYGPELGAAQCTEENGTVKYSSCKPKNCPSETTDYAGMGNDLYLIVPSSIVNNVGTKKCVPNNYCETLGYKNPSNFFSGVNTIKCPLDTSKVYSYVSTPTLIEDIPAIPDDPCSNYTKLESCYTCNKGDISFRITACSPWVEDRNDYNCVYFPSNNECGANSASSCAPQYFKPGYSSAPHCTKSIAKFP